MLSTCEQHCKRTHFPNDNRQRRLTRRNLKQKKCCKHHEMCLVNTKLNTLPRPPPSTFSQNCNAFEREKGCHSGDNQLEFISIWPQVNPSESGFSILRYPLHKDLDIPKEPHDRGPCNPIEPNRSNPYS